jgi:hypothetical protein
MPRVNTLQRINKNMGFKIDQKEALLALALTGVFNNVQSIQSYYLKIEQSPWNTKI